MQIFSIRIALCTHYTNIGHPRLLRIPLFPIFVSFGPSDLGHDRAASALPSSCLVMLRMRLRPQLAYASWAPIISPEGKGWAHE